MAASCQLPDNSSSLSDDHHHPHADAPSVHGMLVFGQERIWMSHLPMFHQPHDYQVVMEVTLTKDGQDLKPLYLDDLAQSAAAYYTFVPKKFSMTHLIAGHLTSLEGTLVRGHFERGGTTVATGVTATVVALPVAEKFMAGAVKPSTAGYYVIGDAAEMFFVHRIVTKPDEFDQVIQVSTDSTVTGIVTTPMVNSPGQRLQSGQQSTIVTSEGATVQVNGGKEVYLETGDLEL
jgi:hypothetical protein